MCKQLKVKAGVGESVEPVFLSVQLVSVVSAAYTGFQPVETITCSMKIWNVTCFPVRTRNLMYPQKFPASPAPSNKFFFFLFEHQTFVTNQDSGQSSFDVLNPFLIIFHQNPISLRGSRLISCNFFPSFCVWLHKRFPEGRQTLHRPPNSIQR